MKYKNQGKPGPGPGWAPKKLYINIESSDEFSENHQPNSPDTSYAKSAIFDEHERAPLSKKIGVGKKNGGTAIHSGPDEHFINPGTSERDERIETVN